MAGHNATGRTGKRKRKRLSEQFIARRRSMIESPAMRVLTGAAHRALMRIELEHAQHGGVENGALPVTYDDFVSYGMDRHSIAPAIRELEALGLIRYRAGKGGNSEFKAPNIYTLTYIPAGDAADETDDWKRITTVDQAKKVQRQARTKKRERRTAKIRIPMGETHTRLVRKSPTSSREKPPHHSGEKPPHPSISREGCAELNHSARAGAGPSAGRAPSARGAQSPTPDEIAALVSDLAKKMQGTQ